MAQWETVAKHLKGLVKKRIRFNLELGCLDDIVVKYMRWELRDITGSGRIENDSISALNDSLAEEGWEVTGGPSAQEFILTVDVIKMLSKFDSLSDLNERNAKHSGLIKVMSAQKAVA